PVAEAYDPLGRRKVLSRIEAVVAAGPVRRAGAPDEGLTVSQVAGTQEKGQLLGYRRSIRPAAAAIGQLNYRSIRSPLKLIIESLLLDIRQDLDGPVLIQIVVVGHDFVKHPGPGRGIRKRIDHRRKMAARIMIIQHAERDVPQVILTLAAP